MCINLETTNNIKPNHIDEKSVSFNRTKLAISKQSETEHQNNNNRSFNDLQVAEFNDTYASLQTEPNLVPAPDISGTNVSFMAENNREISCNNAECHIPVIDNQCAALLRSPTECPQPSENDSLSHKGPKSTKHTTTYTKSKLLNPEGITHYVGKRSKHYDKHHKLSYSDWTSRLPLIEQFPKQLNQHDEIKGKANKQGKTHFKKLQNGLTKPPRSQKGIHSLLMRTPVTPPRGVAHQNFRIRRSYHRAPDWYRHLDLASENHTSRNTCSTPLTPNDQISVPSSLNIVHLNIRSLRNIVHLTEVKELVKLNNIDVLTISESWLNSSVANREIAIDDYKIHRLDRLHKKGGGVCAYIKKNIKATVLKDLSKVSVSNFHQLWINLQCQKNKSIIIYVTYRPPDTFLNCFEDLLKPNYVQALTLNKQILVLGDLNCNMLENGQERRALTNFSTELNLTQIIKTSTRITATSQTLIDVILVSSTALVLESGVINTSISDHLPVYVLLKLKAPKMPACYITTRSYKNYNPSLFSSDLVTKSDRLLSILSNTNVNTILETFKDVLHSTLDVHAPLKTFKIRN
ncbi:Hypothetical predicted protein [Paramuricea clavata]|uniref:Endonuclease/exonuclease/phosphatase domain-containing protein n=1 Tax=Paramuricea clavata TaxID=317549 RepID=A0A6S7KAD5_PARCT|nr:Hypothetical predicted protein [Paramuricea clavata]